MEFVEMRAFVAASRTGTVLGAATALHLTPAPVSRAIKRLEQELGGDLFRRDYHRLVLTPLGERVLPPSVAALSHVRTARHAGWPAPLRIGASLWAPDRFVAQLEAAAAADRPEPAPDLPAPVEDADAGTGATLRAPSAALIHALAHGDLDAAIVHETEQAPGVRTRVLADYAVTFFVAADHPLAGRERVRLEDLAGVPLAIPAEFHRRLSLAGLLTQLDEHGITRVIDLPQTDPVAVARTVRESGAVTIGSTRESTPMLRLTTGHGLIPLVLEGQRPRLSLVLAWHGLADIAGSPLHAAIDRIAPEPADEPELLR